jgi:hypothetical protein
LTTTIAPSSGAGVLFTQQGIGTTPGYSALDLRRSEIVGPVQEGVYAAGDFMVTQRALGGPGMFVDIAAGVPSFAAVQGDSVSGQGLYIVAPHSAAVITEAIAAADPTNPRIDIVILEVQDNVHDASGGNIARTRVVTGTPTAGATLTNRAGVATLPGSALLLADVLVTAAASNVANTQIRDRRKWARGAFTRIPGNLGGSATTAVAMTGSTVVNAAFSVRMECSGLPIRVQFYARAFHSAVGGHVDFMTAVDGTLQNVLHRHTNAATNQNFAGVVMEDTIVPAAGSHTIAAVWGTPSGATATITLASGDGPMMVVEEMVRQVTANNTVTSG